MDREYPSEGKWMQGLELVQEGRVDKDDKSWEWCNKQEDLVNFEKRIILSDFWEQTKQRKLDLEFRIIDRITKTNKHTECLVKFAIETAELNRYKNILPCINYCC